jgi:hypothetical protein
MPQGIRASDYSLYASTGVSNKTYIIGRVRYSTITIYLLIAKRSKDTEIRADILTQKQNWHGHEYRSNMAR